MTERDWNLRNPCGEDYPDGRSAEQRARDQREVCRQVSDLVRRPNDRAFRRELIALLQQRQQERDVDPRRIGSIPSRRGFETLVVWGELLVRAEAMRDPRVEQFLDRYKFETSPIECLEGRVVRLANPEIPATRLDDIARLLRREGIAASVNHITPLGPIAKGLGGPEPSAGARPFPQSIQTQSRQVKVAVIDTGIVEGPRSDGWLNSVPRNDNIDPLDALPGHGDGHLDFGAGHGTFAAGIVQQVAHRADISVYRALDSDGIGSEVDVACAMIQAVREGADILNLSLGAQTIDDQPPVAIEVALEIISEIEQATHRDVLVVAAAGNFGSTRPCWPAAFRRVVSVAGLTADGRPSAWSSRGFWVDFSTIAEGQMSTYVEGDESPEIDPYPDHFGPDPWAVWTGTSFAAPQIAGAVARLSYERDVTSREALRALYAAGTRIADFGYAVRLLPGT